MVCDMGIPFNSNTKLINLSNFVFTTFYLIRFVAMYDTNFATIISLTSYLVIDL